MKKPQPIQIAIPKPCSEDWNKMAPNEQGRFCSHCQKTVIDFTGWSDAALYQFITQNTNKAICGNFAYVQLNRNINLPPQPQSKLYRIFVGLGLTLLFAQIPDAKAKTNPPFVSESSFSNDNDDSIQHQTGSITGTVFDEKKEPMYGAVIEVVQNGIVRGGTTSDIDGNFVIKPLNPGPYDMRVKMMLYKTEIVSNLVVSPEKSTSVNIIMNLDTQKHEEIIVPYHTMGLIDIYVPGGQKMHIDGYKVPLLNKDNPGSGRTITSEEIEKSPY